ncbi:MAG TPA: folylpolyglutamate synthase/dihydrofolate synthase family protein [Geobacteraceae bacterium]
MTYEETLSHIYGRGRFGIKPGLERISALLHELGNPQEQVTTLQVAGTNGKGSTCAFLSAILAAAGLKVGLFTSPHLTRFTERIRVNGQEAAEDEVVRLAGRVLATASAEATFFEIVTALALTHFAEQRVDLAVMEVGMGGRFDATSAAPGVLSVITPISLDHCEYLGADVAAIAREKAGIIRTGRPVVTAPQPAPALAMIDSRCRELGAPLYLCGKDFAATWGDNGLNYRGMGATLTALHPGIGGRYQSVNAACALAAAELLDRSGIGVPYGALAQGIAEATWPGRMELMGSEPRILLDGAHNPASAQALAEALGEVPHRRLILVLGVMGDKDLTGIVGPLLPRASRVVAVSPALDRALPADTLAAFCRSLGAECCVGGTVAAGLALARAAAGARDLVLVTGSLFTVGEARAHLLGNRFEPFRG